MTRNRYARENRPAISSAAQPAPRERTIIHRSKERPNGRVLGRHNKNDAPAPRLLSLSFASSSLHKARISGSVCPVSRRARAGERKFPVPGMFRKNARIIRRLGERSVALTVQKIVADNRIYRQKSVARAWAGALPDYRLHHRRRSARATPRRINA